ncbi:DUF6273 domain-containing protein [Succinimonas amylolytica]|uniref:DUF6273 domain-containing protein n=1 Tax=Succinimonas amylolytica TaxID=83769 RepID=UPI0023A7C76E
MALSSTDIGSRTEFGSYFLSENATTKDPLTWIVLDRDAESVLLLTEFGIDCRCYHPGCGDITWENSEYRSWLNGEFYSTAFSADEKELILETVNRNPDNELYHTRGGNDTRDRVFALSLDEVKHYLPDTRSRQTTPTPFTLAKNLWTHKDKTCYWWLRSPGIMQYNAATIYYSGLVSDIGCFTGDEKVAARPAIRVRI